LLDLGGVVSIWAGFRTTGSLAGWAFPVHLRGSLHDCDAGRLRAEILDDARSISLSDGLVERTSGSVLVRYKEIHVEEDAVGREHGDWSRRIMDELPPVKHGTIRPPG